MLEPSTGSLPRKLDNKPTLYIYTHAQELTTHLKHWLSAFNCQLGNSVSSLRQGLLDSTCSYILVDVTSVNDAILKQVAFFHENFPNHVIMALIKEDQAHVGQECFNLGADSYVSMTHCSSQGLQVQFASLAKQKMQTGVSLAGSIVGLPVISQALFLDRLTHALMVAIRHQCYTGILLVEISDYEGLNNTRLQDNTGHFIPELSAPILSVIRNSDSLSYMGLGVFAVLLEDLRGEIMVAHIAQKIQTIFSSPVQLNDQWVSVNLSLGGHLCHHDQGSAQTLLLEAKVALKRSKNKLQQGLCFYEQALNFKTTARANMEQGIIRALQEQQLFVQFQPLHCGRGFKLLGMEAKIRWQHPASGVVLPDVFMGLVEDSGLIIDVGSWWIEESLKQFKHWKKNGHTEACQRIYIDVSEKQIRFKGFIEMLISHLALNDIGAEKLVLMVCEKVVMKNKSLLKELTICIPGICLAVRLSDFSKGYSSLGYLKEIDVDSLYLDECFFRYIYSDKTKMSVAKIIIDIAHNLGINVMADGANTQMKVDKMQSLEIDCLQGEFFCAPLYGELWPDYIRKLSR
jgi:EAL domain-containing protein (putative c-di-GMP-specific phosphodiesterase class I)/GGDEF domain-containing protein